MRKCSLLRFVVPVLCSMNILHGVSNKYLPNMGHSPDSPLDKIRPYPSLKYKGIYNINEYGWFITQNWDNRLQKVLYGDKWYEVKEYYPHPTLGFAIFKIDLLNDTQREQDQKFKYLGNKVDLESNSGWVTSCAFIPDRYASEGKIGTERYGYSKPLSGISKIEKRENGYLTLGLRKSLEDIYEDILLAPSKRLLNRINIIDKILETPSDQADYIQINRLRLAQEKIKDLNKRIDGCKETYLNGLQSIYKEKFILGDAVRKFYSIPDVIEGYRKIQLLRGQENSNQKEIFDLLSDYQISCWEIEKQELQKILDSYPTNADLIHRQFCFLLKDNFIQDIKTNPNNRFRSCYLGVPDKEDNGGVVLVPSREKHKVGNKECDYLKVVGITCINDTDDYIQGKRSSAIDLTTDQVRQWISDTMDAYYRKQETQLREKRSAENEAGPSNQIKRVRVKEEPVEDDSARRSADVNNNNNVQVKQEVKEEIKEEIKKEN